MESRTRRNIFAFCNQKGGVGKTTSVINIGAYLGSTDHRVLLIDIDAQANLTSGLGKDKPEISCTTYALLVENADPASLIRKTEFRNLYIIPSSSELAGVELELISRIGREYSLKNQLQKISEDFDFVLIDCPPSLGLITINALTTSSYVMIPLQCEYYALEGLSQLLTTQDLIRRNLNSMLEVGGVILTMADFRTNLTEQVIEEVRSHFGEKVFESVVPRSVKLSEAPSFGKPAIFYDPASRGSKAYVEVGREFLRRFGAEGSRKQDSGANSDDKVAELMKRPISAVEGSA